MLNNKEPLEEWQLLGQYGRDMHSFYFVEAICIHGIGHHAGVHGCDGCCANCPKAIWKRVTNDKEEEECKRCGLTRYTLKNYEVPLCVAENGKTYKRHCFV